MSTAASSKPREKAAKGATNGAAEAPASDGIRHIQIPEIRMEHAILTLVGITPLIQHKWSAKQQKQLEDKVTGKAKEQRSARDPEAEWKEAAYIIAGKENHPDWKPGKYYHPAEAFKHAYLYGVSQLSDTKTFPKTKATGWVFPDDDLVLTFESVELRTDISRKPTQPVYRPQFNGWGGDLPVSYMANAISLEQVVAIFDLGGFSGGVGEWRPSAPINKSGSHGRFRVARVRSSENGKTR